MSPGKARKLLEYGLEFPAFVLLQSSPILPASLGGSALNVGIYAAAHPVSWNHPAHRRYGSGCPVSTDAPEAVLPGKLADAALPI